VKTSRNIMKHRVSILRRVLHYLPFYASFGKKLSSSTFFERHRRIIAQKLFNKSVDRNQWSNKEGSSRETYKKLILYSWEETKSNAPQYFQRLDFVVKRCKGEVMEIGCGIGTMTRWICKSNKVKKVVAIDASSEAIEELKTSRLPKVTPLQMQLENIKFNDTIKFDTVVICEVIEHIYPAEEKRMLNALKPYIDSETAFIVSTPIGWMRDPHHTRGFSKSKFSKHLKSYYGDPVEIDYSSGYSQAAFGYFNVRSNPLFLRTNKMRSGRTISNEERNMKNYTNYVKKQIVSKNPWYTGSQFVWADKENVRRIYNKRFLFFSKIIKREINKKERITLLDYGCGDGYWSLVLSQFVACEITGVDYNPLRIERAKSIIKNAKFFELNLEDANEQLGKFDIVFCSQVIEHIKDDVSFLNNIIRHYLKEHGVLILGTPNEGSLLHRFRNYITKGETDHVHFYKEKEIKNKIEKAGFVIKDIYREVFFPGIDKLYYRLSSRNFGFKTLELLTILFPSQCSDYYFECKRR